MGSFCALAGLGDFVFARLQKLASSSMFFDTSRISLISRCTVHLPGLLLRVRMAKRAFFEIGEERIELSGQFLGGRVLPQQPRTVGAKGQADRVDLALRHGLFRLDLLQLGDRGFQLLRLFAFTLSRAREFAISAYRILDRADHTLDRDHREKSTAGDGRYNFAARFNRALISLATAQTTFTTTLDCAQNRSLTFLFCFCAKVSARFCSISFSKGVDFAFELLIEGVHQRLGILRNLSLFELGVG